MINSFYGWAWNWPNMKPQPKPGPCEWEDILFNVRKDCDRIGTTQIDDHWYCDEHATDDMSYGRVKPAEEVK